MITNKTPEEMELLAVWANSRASTIHVIRVSENPQWHPGEQARTICGRTIDEAWITEEVSEGDKPCGNCDRITSVLVAMFETSAIVGEVMEQAGRLEFMHWLSHGIVHGWVTAPLCIKEDPHFREAVEAFMSHHEMDEEQCLMILALDIEGEYFPRMHGRHGG